MPGGRGVEVDVSHLYHERPALPHPWFAMRPPAAARVAVSLVLDPMLGKDDSALSRIAAGTKAVTLARLWSDESRPPDVLDLCSGGGAIAREAARLGAHVTAVDAHPIPVLINRAVFELPERLGGRLVGPDGSEQLIGDALLAWAEVTASRVTARWMEGAPTGSVLMSAVVRCSKCGSVARLAPRDRDAVGLQLVEGAALAPLGRGVARCPHCDAEFNVRQQRTGRYEPVAVLSGDAATDEVATLAWDGDDITARSPRQAAQLADLETSFDEVRQTLTYLEMPAEQQRAVELFLVLGVSAHSDYLSLGASWRRGHAVVDSARRWRRLPTAHYVEIGTTDLVALWSRHWGRLSPALNEANLPGSIDSTAADMIALPFEEDSFDVVAWDPPFYDNIDYDAVAAPWLEIIRRLLTKEADAFEVHEAAKLLSASPEEQHEQLRLAATEAARVLRPGGQLAVFWVVREPEEIVSFLRSLQPAGFELIDTVRLRPPTPPQRS